MHQYEPFALIPIFPTFTSAALIDPLFGDRLASVAVPPVLKACIALAATNSGKHVHSLTLTRGFCSNVYIQTAPINFYVKTNDMVSTRRVFDEIGVKDLITYNCLITGYSKLGNVMESRCLFDEMTDRASATWNAVISCYTSVGDFAEALRLFEWMQMERMRPNEITAVTVLLICMKLGDLSLGLWVKKMVDGYAQRTKLIVQTVVLEMYVKCGAVDEARIEFDRMGVRGVVAWNAMIADYAHN